MLFIYGVGRLGRDPEITTIQGQNGPVKKATFSVAFDRPFGDEVDWLRFSVLGKRADTIEKYFHKGSEIEIQGRPESYKGHDDHIYWSVRTLDFAFTGGTSASRDQAPQASSQTSGRASAQTAEQASSQTSEASDIFEDIDDDVLF